MLCGRPHWGALGKEMKITEQDLIDGKLLRKLILEYKKDSTNEEKLLNILQCLRDSYIWIPCNIEFDNKDDIEKFASGKIGDTISPKGNIHLKPDILRNGETFFLPVFSSAGAMGEYGENFSKIEKHFFEAASLSNGHEETVGIVIDAFTEPFIVTKELFSIVEKMPSIYMPEEK